MQSANLLEGGSGGGGLYGQDRDVLIDNLRFEEHGFEKKDKATGAVTQKFAPSTMLVVDIFVEDRREDEPESMAQYYPVGKLPSARLAELGWPVGTQDNDPKNPGGYEPSVDNENPAVSGPFVVLDGKSDIWKDSPYMQLMEEFKQLGLMEHAERFAAQGVACLNKTRLHLGTKAMPKSKKQQQTEQLSGQSKDARTILVPTRIHNWGWEDASDATPAATPAPAKPAAAPKAAAAPKPAAAAAPAATATPAATTTASAGDNGALTADDDEKIAGYVVEAITKSGGTLKKANLALKLLPFVSKVGVKRTPYVQRAASDEFLTALSGVTWNYDVESATLTAIA